ncbi:oxysterol-binding protein-related protein 1D isoform X2 [Aegilops tauschii subsp. strangulata]|uniref:oxysterol-binding protein-related protein 1D isoform X2 n=1 Tax=Aegilops tauschii subsp. strangulata TaxID=200361 RepID=UPI00098A6562|nr:oxysterol-binding protein-related protein 1D isoform X2 [Aegilops tauschii subsp. strangulata]
MNPLCCIAPVSVDYAADHHHHHQPRSVAAATLSATPEAAPPQTTPPVVSGVLHKWVNYGKGWRSRWFVLEDGVLSYYKLRDGGGESGESSASTAAARVIGEGDALRRAREDAAAAGKQWKPFGDIHLKVSSIRASRSDDKRLYIFSGTKTLHLRCETEEDRNAWLEALLVAKDRFPRSLMTNDFAPVADIMLSTEKLRMRLLHEGLNETVVNECESIMMTELLELHNQIKSQQQQHSVLVDRLRQLETEKVELERTVVHETKEREAHGYVNGRYSDFYSVLSGGSASESDPDTASQVADAESEDEVTYFDTRDFLSVESLRSASRRRELVTNGCNALESIGDSRSYTAKFTKYPIVERRDKLPEPKEKEKPIGLWSIIKENIGKDLSGVCLPVYFNEPLSSLQKCFEDLEYSYLVDNALQWGKQYQAMLQLKVSHHPVVVACHCDGRGWKFWGDSNLRGKFWGRSIQLDPIGVLTLQFDDGEKFQWSKVTTSIYNIIIGKIYCDHYGTMHIKGSSRYSCKLKFKELSIIDRNPHQVQGFVQDNRTGEKVAMLIGKWDEAMYYVLGDPSAKPKWYDPMSEAVLLWERDKSLNQTRYNLSPFAISLNELPPHMLTMLPPTDSRLRPDQRHLENGEYEKANSEKLRLEQLQRQARRLQEKGWQPRWFRKDEDDSYCYLGGYWEAREKGNWDGIPHIFGQSSALTG